MTTTLICTVGGSHQPIVTAIRTLKPDFVCFVCSQDDLTTGSKGSYVQITGEGNIIKAHPRDDKPTLPNIPAQTGLDEGQFEILKVPPDDFDTIYQRISDWLQHRNPNQERLVADYTGGTKTMTAALACAALDHGQVELQLVTGRRDNLIKVENGEIAMPASVMRTRFQRRLQQALLLWQSYAYGQAQLLIEDIPLQPDWHADYIAARDLSKAFARWDRFDHAGAAAILLPYRNRLGRHGLGELLGTLTLLTGESPAREPLRILDLFRNAERRAAQGRYDDAVARLYRLLEWSAQWLLRERAGIDTADIPADKIPDDLPIPRNRAGKYQAGLHDAWELAAEHAGEAVKRFWQAEKDKMLDLLQSRNRSILAHGFTPLTEGDWQAFHHWTETRFLPMLLGITSDPHYRIRKLTPQLPDHYPLQTEQDRP